MTTTTSTQPPDGYTDVSIPLPEVMARVTILSLVLLVVPMLVYIVIYGFDEFWSGVFDNDNFLVWLIIFVVTIALAVVAHEGIHAIGWKLFSGLGWDQIKFGIDRKTLSPYCHARAPMRASAYRIGAALPGILLGVVPIIVGLVGASAGWTAFGALLLSAAVGDALVLWVIRDVPADAWVLDHPSNAGCYVKVG
jgi:hypothetical protein